MFGETRVCHQVQGHEVYCATYLYSSSSSSSSSKESMAFGFGRYRQNDLILHVGPSGASHHKMQLDSFSDTMKRITRMAKIHAVLATFMRDSSEP